MATRKAQQEVEERWCERISCYSDGVYSIGLCILRILTENLFHVNQNSGKKGSIARYYPKVCAS